MLHSEQKSKPLIRTNIFLSAFQRDVPESTCGEAGHYCRRVVPLNSRQAPTARIEKASILELVRQQRRAARLIAGWQACNRR